MALGQKLIREEGTEEAEQFLDDNLCAVNIIKEQYFEKGQRADAHADIYDLAYVTGKRLSY